MDRKRLAIALSKLKVIENGNVSLEQYQIGSELAADMLWIAYTAGDIENCVVADFGCGNGILGIGALLLGAKEVYFLDCDEKMIELTKGNLTNVKRLGTKAKIHFILDDVSKFDKKVDTVLMNPPFGVQKRKADKIFLITAMKYATKVYSLHKIESEGFLRQVTIDNGFCVEGIIRKNFVIKKSYEFHSKNKYDIEVGIWILKKR